MLKKLIKHEWKDTWSVGTTCSVIVLVLTIIGLFVLNEDIWRESANRSDMAEDFTVITMMLYLMMFVWGLVAAAFVVRYYFFWRYYKNLFTDQGYLMNTLPVKSTDLCTGYGRGRWNSSLFMERVLAGAAGTFQGN